MAKFLLIYSTTDGQTLKISQRLRDVIESHGHEVTLIAIDDAGAAEPSAYDHIVVGARIRYGHHHPQVVDFVRRHRAALETRPCGFFSVNVVARKPNRNTPESNPYVRKFLRRTGWQPRYQAVFAGRIAYPSYGRLDRMIIRLIMWLTHGPTDPAAVVEFTDWQAVEDFGRQIAQAARPGTPAA